jgi:hypothetical protein
MKFVRVGADLDLSNATLFALDLWGATIEAEFRLSETCWQATAAARSDKPPGSPDRGACVSSNVAGGTCTAGSRTRLILVNAHIGTLLRDDLSAWPPCLELSGLIYTHLGASGGTTSKGNVETWRAWLERDRRYSPQPYAQLASVMAAQGDRDGANAIQYYGREQERAQAYEHKEFGTYLPLTMLWAAAGYGIGDYTWRALGWVFGLTMLGTLVVYSVRTARDRGPLWPIGASLEKLLPYVHLDRSFSDFFERQEGFAWWHKVAFCLLALLGSALGLFFSRGSVGADTKRLAYSDGRGAAHTWQTLARANPS